MVTLSVSSSEIQLGESITLTLSQTAQGVSYFYNSDGTRFIVENQGESYQLFIPRFSSSVTFTPTVSGEYNIYISIPTEEDSLNSNTVTFTVVSPPQPTGSWSINNKTVASLHIGQKEIQTITRVSDGAILYQKNTGQTSTPASMSVTATKDVLSDYHDDTSTLTATVLDANNNPCSSQTVTFKNGSTILGTDTTDANGQAEYTYTSNGSGNVTITAECESITQTYNLEDIHYADMSEHSLTRSGTTIAGRINNDTFTLPSDCEITFDIFCDTNVSQGSEDRFFITDLGHLSTTGQPAQGVYVGFNRPSNMEYGYRNNSTSWYLYNINYQNNWVSCKIVRSNVSTWSYYFNGTLASSKSYSGLNSYSSFVFNYVMWANSTMKIKNIKIKITGSSSGGTGIK